MVSSYTPLSAPVSLPFDCLSNLKQAIDWILRVTGKDGQGSDNTRALAKAVRELLQSAVTEISHMISKGHVRGDEFNELKEGLEKAEEWVEKDVTIGFFGNTNGPISHLSDGLAAFIGYGSKGTFSDYSTTGRLTGAGIAPSNIATHRLCDAAIAFTIGVLEGCKSNNGKGIHLKTVHISTIDDVIKKLHGKYGQGPEKLNDLGGQMKSELTKAKFRQTGIDSFLDDIGTGFQKNLSSLRGQPSNVAQSVGEYLKGMFNGKGSKTWGDPKDISTKLKELYTDFTSDDKLYDASSLSQKIKKVGEQLEPTHPTVQPILEAGKEEFIWHLEKAYVSYYSPSANWPSSDGDGRQKNCAQIFLGCIPLIYHCLTQLYWLCHDSGPWDTQRFHDPRGSGLRNIMVALGYSDYYLSSQQGKIVVKSAMQGFSEFTAAQPKGTYPQLTTPYHAFLNKLTSNLNNAIKPSSSDLTNHTIPALYHIARLYFRHQQGRNPGKTRPPSSIREMLYWLSGLQFSPQYDSLQSHISGVFRNLLGKPPTTDDNILSLDVADSGATKDSNNTLSAADLKGYVTMTCLYSPMVLGRIQGPGASTGIDEPYLHHLFGNGMSFAYPSGAALLSKLSEYAYALQFQLSFLTQKCFTHNGDGCGWRHCRFGKDIEPRSSASPVTSHICHAGCTHGNAGSSHQCSHDGSKCGQSGGKASPLQAFLTDNLQGFRRSHPGTSYHLDSCSSNSMCHVPMGFKAEYLRENPGYGYHVFYPLLFYCSDHTRPLRLLSDKLHFISNYTPRSLGDMLGFYLHLCRQVFNIRPDNLSTYISGLLKTQQHQSRAGLLIFEYLENSIVELGSALHGVVRHCHNRKASDSAGQIKHQNVSGGSCSHSNSTPADLWSLFALDNPSKYPNCATGQKCGAYLSPLTRSHGSTFGKSAGFASTYLSWVSYLADDFKERLESLLTDFRNITCTDCRTQNGKTCSCTKGSHGTSPQCSCDSVVSCSGVLPLFYEHGFNFLNVQSLSGKVGGGTQTKRTCQHFQSQLQNVINGDPLYTLLLAVDGFLYAIRWEFFSKLSGFWTIYICLILYTFFFLLDTLHLRSHLKLTSHVLPPLTLLTSGQPLPITKLTYITQ
ncbi:variant erythrocyte surface antigen-1 family protein [Babesia caballi]|uniref:Variant erythrocyte surface antigen-1 family protein n=1 Tax=Babesia caballi TaxID=5871 RepID=A0AAV4LZS5_BABCB|nr:variant erythrocyte surface antigen-1 family protein [Babesia caballi]